MKTHDLLRMEDCQPGGAGRCKRTKKTPRYWGEGLLWRPILGGTDPALTVFNPVEGKIEMGLVSQNYQEC